MKHKSEIYRLLLWFGIFIAVISLADIAAAAYVRVHTGENPAVAGDISKVGMGAIGGAIGTLIATHFRNGNGHNGNKS